MPSKYKGTAPSEATPAAAPVGMDAVNPEKSFTMAMQPPKRSTFNINTTGWPTLLEACGHFGRGGKNRSHKGQFQFTMKAAAPVKLETDYLAVLSGQPKSVYYVLDTNVYIEYHTELEDILAQSYEGCQPVLVVSYKVVQELERLKHTKVYLASDVNAATNFILHGLHTPAARIVGQHPRDMDVAFMPILSADDYIVNCALQVKSLADRLDVAVVLVSRDHNMQIKASMAKLKSCSMATLKNRDKF